MSSIQNSLPECDHRQTELERLIQLLDSSVFAYARVSDLGSASATANSKELIAQIRKENRDREALKDALRCYIIVNAASYVTLVFVTRLRVIMDEHVSNAFLRSFHEGEFSFTTNPRPEFFKSHMKKYDLQKDDLRDGVKNPSEIIQEFLRSSWMELMGLSPEEAKAWPFDVSGDGACVSAALTMLVKKRNAIAHGNSTSDTRSADKYGKFALRVGEWFEGNLTPDIFALDDD